MSARTRPARRARLPLAALALAGALAALSFAPREARAVPATELVARARTAAAHEDWNSAARALEELTAAGVDSSDVLYNLGTVYARAGRYGEAIWCLERVARRSPFAGDAQQNLRAARLLLAHRDAARTGRAVVETATPLLTSLAELLPADWGVALAVLAELAAIACLVLWRRRKSGETTRVAGIAGLVLFTALALFFGGSVVARRFVPPAAVVLHDGLHLLHTPAADAIAEAAVREGERVDVLGREGGFARVRTPTGEQGWLATHDLGLLAE